MFLSNWTIPLSGVCLRREINVRQTAVLPLAGANSRFRVTGYQRNRINATSTCKQRAADRATMYVHVYVARALFKLSCMRLRIRPYFLMTHDAHTLRA